jgi:redox-sensitive bicupin YhaK (pirin superfamily)
VIHVLPAEQRYLTRQPGIVTWSCFASGSHYDPANVAFGGLTAVDEHLLDPGAGFARHRHRGVDLVTYVISGTLLHEDEDGISSTVNAGELQLQHAGAGIAHEERNESDRRQLRIVQMALLSDDERGGRTAAALPVELPGATLTEVTDAAELPQARHHLHVLAGSFTVAGGADLRPGDSLRADEQVVIDGRGRALLWTLR